MNNPNGKSSKKGGKHMGAMMVRRTRNGTQVRLQTQLARVLSTYGESICPNEMDVVLKFVRVAAISGATTTLAQRFNPNDAFAVDPTGASSPKGFAGWATFYGFYRVVVYSYTITVVNRQATPVTITVVNSDNDPGTTFNASIAGNPLTQQKILSAAGGLDKCTFTGNHTVADVLGSDSVEFDDTYRALNNASPADVIWLSIGAQDLTGANLTNGVDYILHLSMYTRFYDRLIL
jgi:hypothetical protein